MAPQTLPAFPFPGFPQALDSFIGREIAYVERLMARTELGSCCFERCQAEAEVSDLETGAGYCRTHFRGVERA